MSPIVSQLGELVVFVCNVFPFSDLIYVFEPNRYLCCCLTIIYCFQAFLSSQDLCISPSGTSLAEPKWRWNRSQVQSALADSRRFSSTKGLDFYFLMFITFKNLFFSRFFPIYCKVVSVSQSFWQEAPYDPYSPCQYRAL